MPHALCYIPCAPCSRHTLFFFSAFPPGPLPARRLIGWRLKGRRPHSDICPLTSVLCLLTSVLKSLTSVLCLPFSVLRSLSSVLCLPFSVLRSLSSVLCLPSSVLRLTRSPFPKKPDTFSVRQSACRWQFPWQPASLWQSFYRFFQAPHKRL